MPLALTLQANTRALLAGSARLDAWNKLVLIEALLVARARSAFLVRWFGPLVPLAGSRLRIAISNLPALRERYLALEAQTRSPREAEGLDIVQPFANMLGTVASNFINPLTLLTILLAGAFTSFGRISKLVLNFLFGPLLPLILVFTGPFLLAPLLFSSPKELVEGYPLALAIGAMLPPLSELFTVLDHNFDAVVGNLLDLYVLFTSSGGPSVPLDLARVGAIFAAIEPLADSLAVFIPLLFLSLGWLIVRVGPQLEPLAVVLPAFLRLVFSVISAIGALFKDLVAGFEKLVGRAKGGVGEMLSKLTLGGKFLQRIGGHFSRLFDAFKGFFDGDKIAKAAADWKRVIIEGLKKAFLEHPLVVFLGNLITSIKEALANIARIAMVAGRIAAGEVGRHLAGPFGQLLAQKLFDHLTAPSKEPSLADRLVAFLKSAIPDHQAILAGLPKPLTVKEAFPEKLFSEQPPEVPKELLARRSLFDRERRALFAGGAAAAAIDRRERELRGFLFGVVGSLLPAKIGGHLEQLRDLLRRIDRSLDRQGPVSRFPVKRPEDPAQLRPKVGRVRFVVRGGAADGSTRERVDRWAKGLRRVLVEQSYPAVVPATVEVV